MARLLSPAAFRAAVRRFVREQQLADAGQPILVACSGGADSVALLHVLHSLGHPVAVAHVNYGLRGDDSDADARFVRELAARLGVPCAECTASARQLAEAEGLSLQVAARRIRYRFFREELKRLGWTRVATAHHRGDQAETLLLTLLRSRSVELLRGIPVQRGAVIRPLLFASKEQLIHYLEAQGLTWRDDRSNASLAYLRNRIRHRVLPALAAINPRIEEHLVERGRTYERQFRALTHEHDPEQLLAGVLKKSTPDSIAIDFALLRSKYPNPNTFHVLFQYFLEKKYRLRPTDASRLVRLVDAQSGTRIETPLGWWWRTAEGLRLVAPERAAACDELPLVFESASSPSDAWRTIRPGSASVPTGRLHFSILNSSQATLPPPRGTAYLDIDRLAGLLVLRPWRVGERFQPLGLSGTRLVSDELTDAKFPSQLRKQARVLADDGGPVWIETGRIAQRVALSETTQRVLRIEWLPSGADEPQ